MQLGFSKGTVIGILTNDPIQSITAMISILKAGCTFVPLDTRLPEKRLADLLAIVAPEIICIEKDLYDLVLRLKLKANIQAKLVCLNPKINYIDPLEVFSKNIQSYLFHTK